MRLALAAILMLAVGPASAAWTYETSTDKMGRGQIGYASTASLNTLTFRFPYNGGSTGRLWLRKGSPRDAVMVDVTKGQMICRPSDCYVTLRFDAEKPVRWSAARPSDGSSDTLFILNHKGFAAKALKSKSLLVEVEFFHHGAEVLEFDLSGLKWKF